jgi:hypothetical protein
MQRATRNRPTALRALGQRWAMNRSLPDSVGDAEELPNSAGAEEMQAQSAAFATMLLSVEAAVCRGFACQPVGVGGFPRLRARRGTVSLRADRLVGISKEVRAPEDARLGGEARARPRLIGRMLVGGIRRAGLSAATFAFVAMRACAPPASCR